MSHLIVSLRIWSDFTRPEDMCRIVGCEPDSMNLKGSDKDPPRANPPSHGIFFKVYDDDESDDIVGRVSELIERVRGLAGGIQKLRHSDPTTEVSFGISVRPFKLGLSFYFGRDVIAVLNELGADLDIDFFEG